MFYNYVLKHNSCFAAIRLKSPSSEKLLMMGRAMDRCMCRSVCAPKNGWLPLRMYVSKEIERIKKVMYDKGKKRHL